MDVIEVHQYTATRTGNFYTIRSRGLVIGRLNPVDGMWVSRLSAINLGRAGKVVVWRNPGQAMQDFLLREGFLTDL